MFGMSEMQYISVTCVSLCDITQVSLAVVFRINALHLSSKIHYILTFSNHAEQKRHIAM